MFKTILFLCVLSVSTFIYSQTVTTVEEGAFTDGLAIDSQGVIYGSDWGGNTVYTYNTNGNVSVFKDGFSNPNGIGINAQDAIYICDHTANTIFKYNTNGDLLESWGVADGLVTPAGIKSIPNTNDMLLVEYGTYNPDGSFISSSKIKRLNENGTIDTLLDGEGTSLFGPAGITFINNTPYIGNFNDRKIFRFENNILTEIAQLPATAPNNNFLGFLSDLNGTLLATQLGEHKIYRIDPETGEVTLYAGSVAGNDDGDLDTVTFNFPNGILGDDTTDTVYISDGISKNLRIINNATLSNNEFINNESDIALYPNPAKDSLHIKIDNVRENKLFINIIAISGKSVFFQEYAIQDSEFETVIDVKPMASGVYTIVLEYDSKKISKKIIF